MPFVYHAKLAMWYAERPPPTRGGLFHIEYPIRPLVGRFHRMATLLLTLSITLSVVMWVVMRIIYPQPASHVDDISGYEALLPGEMTNPENYLFHRLGNGSEQQETELNSEQTNTYMNSAHNPQVVIIDVSYKQKMIVRFSIFSNQLRLMDLLWRWGRPTYKKKAVGADHWEFKWVGNEYTVSVNCHTLRLDALATLVIITLN